MSIDTPVLVLPGLSNSGPQHWQTLWGLRHPKWQRVNLRNWDSPACDDWVRALDAAVKACPSPPVLVAHSLACLLVAHWAHRSSLVPKGAFLVAVPDPQSARFPAMARGFVPGMSSSNCHCSFSWRAGGEPFSRRRVFERGLGWLGACSSC